MKINTVKLILLAGIMTLSSTAFAGNKNKNKHRDKGHHPSHKQFVYGKVISVTPIYREIRVSHPVQECWSEPVRYPRRDRYVDNSLGNTVAGGLIGGIIGNQIGKGRGKKLATAVGTIVGAQIGHDSSGRSHEKESYGGYTRYEEHCETRDRVSYEEVVDSYRVSYRYKGKRYQTNMPYDPGKKIKLKLTVEPMF